MSVYRGVVRNGAVELPADAGLADGTVVEIRTVASASPDDAAPDERERRQDLARRLREAGLVLEFKHPPYPIPSGERTPIEVKGKPLSEQIIEDRR